MGELGVDALLLSHGADLPWLTGYRAMPLERLTMLVLPAGGEPVLVVPALEAPRVAGRRRPVLPAAVDRHRGPDRSGDLAPAAGRRGRATLAPGHLRPGLDHHRPRPPAPAARRPMDRGIHGHLAHPRRQGRLRAGRTQAAGAAADRVAAVLQAGEIPLVGQHRGGGVGPHRRPADRGRPPAGQLRHRGQRAQCRQPPSRAGRAGHRAGARPWCATSAAPTRSTEMSATARTSPGPWSPVSRPTEVEECYEVLHGRPAARGARRPGPG